MKSNKEIISFLKDKGFVFLGSEIYGGLANSWDYGPLGSMLKDNIKNIWKKYFIDQEPNIFHLDSSIFLNSKVWKASGHLEKFNDPMVDCKNCHQRYRADHLVTDFCKINTTNLSNKELSEIINKINCPNCNKKEWTDVRSFQLMFEVDNSIIGKKEILYLRPETAQGIFINFLNIINTSNPPIPFGVGQVGKAFRNEVTPGNFIFRTKEFEQMELEFFIKPKEQNKWFIFYVNKINEFFKILGLSPRNIKEIEVPKKELAHYSSRTIDFEFNFPFGWEELLGIANRKDFDLVKHSKHSNKLLEYIDKKNNEKYIPHIIEISFGVERLLYAIIANSFKTQKIDDGEREVLELPFSLAPYKLAIAPLTNKLNKEAIEIYHSLLKQDLGPIILTMGGTIGKRYRKQDAIGTPFVVTYDFDSTKDEKVTIRFRNSMKQERILISSIKNYIFKNAK